jgi:phosphatidylglycerophosphatase A
MMAAMPPSRDTRMVDGFARFTATAFFSGHSPVAPGTAGSLVGLFLFWPLQGRSLSVVAAALVGVFLLGWWAAGRLARRLGVHDPGMVVIDEVLGVWVALFGLPFTPGVAVIGFLLFRLFDVVKPYPAGALEHLPGGLGIMADDIAAGLYANLALRVAFLVWPAS